MDITIKGELYIPELKVITEITLVEEIYMDSSKVTVLELKELAAEILQERYGEKVKLAGINL